MSLLDIARNIAMVPNTVISAIGGGKGMLLMKDCLTHRWRGGYLGLLEKLRVNKRCRPYYLQRLSEFFRHYPETARKDLHHDDVADFLAALTERPGIEEWQVLQARHALDIYFEQFRAKAKTSTSNACAASLDSSD